MHFSPQLTVSKPSANCEFAPTLKMRYHWGLHMEEPSVLDYVKSKIFFWRGERVEIPPLQKVSKPEGSQIEPQELDLEGIFEPSNESVGEALVPFEIFRWPGWFVAFPLVLALLAGAALTPPTRSLNTGVVFYLLTAVVVVWAQKRGHLNLPTAKTSPPRAVSRSFHSLGLWVSLFAGIVAFLAFGGNRFTLFNFSLWLLSLTAFFLCLLGPSFGERELDPQAAYRH